MHPHLMQRQGWYNPQRRHSASHADDKRYIGNYAYFATQVNSKAE